VTTLVVGCATNGIIVGGAANSKFESLHGAYLINYWLPVAGLALLVAAVVSSKASAEKGRKLFLESAKRCRLPVEVEESEEEEENKSSLNIRLKLGHFASGTFPKNVSS